MCPNMICDVAAGCGTVRGFLKRQQEPQSTAHKFGDKKTMEFALARARAPRMYRCVAYTFRAARTTVAFKRQTCRMHDVANSPVFISAEPLRLIPLTYACTDV